jgi:hypothetical protein
MILPQTLECYLIFSSLFDVDGQSGTRLEQQGLDDLLKIRVLSAGLIHQVAPSISGLFPWANGFRCFSEQPTDAGFHPSGI